MRDESKYHYFMRELYTETGKLVTYLYDNIPEALHKNNTSDKSMMDSSFSIMVDFVSIHKSYDLDDYRLIVNCELDMGYDEEYYEMKCNIPYKLLGKSDEEIDEYFRKYYERQKKKQEEYDEFEKRRKQRLILKSVAEGIDEGLLKQEQFQICQNPFRSYPCHNSYICKNGTTVCLLNNSGIVRGTNNDAIECLDYDY